MSGSWEDELQLRKDILLKNEETKRQLWEEKEESILTCFRIQNLLLSKASISEYKGRCMTWFLLQVLFKMSWLKNLYNFLKLLSFSYKEKEKDVKSAQL